MYNYNITKFPDIRFYFVDISHIDYGWQETKQFTSAKKAFQFVEKHKSENPDNSQELKLVLLSLEN